MLRRGSLVRRTGQPGSQRKGGSKSLRLHPPANSIQTWARHARQPREREGERDIRAAQQVHHKGKGQHEQSDEPHLQA